MWPIRFLGRHAESCQSIIAVLMVSLIVGCGGGAADDRPKGSVTGTVTIGGEAFVSGAIQFSSVQTPGESFGAEMTPEGEFKVAAAIPAGSYTVSLSPPTVGPVTGPDGVERPATIDEIKHNIPQKYLSHTTSDQTIEIKEGSNTLTIELKP